MLKRIYGHNICFDCTKACGKCSWSKNFEPVPGWTAEKCILPITNQCSVRHMETYHITACPEFELDNRKVVPFHE
jgi:hypothetical protein